MSLPAKLKFVIDQPLWLLNAPEDIKTVFSGFTLKKTLPEKAEVSQVVFFAKDSKALETQFPEIVRTLTDNAVFWIAYAKKSSGMASDLLITDNWKAVFDNGYHIVSSAAIDNIWSGVRIRKKDADAKYKSSVPMEQRRVKGIDYVNRTVSLPEDAIQAMKPYKGLADFFNTMSFTHKREHIEAIEEARKPETRLRRIEKMIEMVLELKIKKEQKKK